MAAAACVPLTILINNLRLGEYSILLVLYLYVEYNTIYKGTELSYDD